MIDKQDTDASEALASIHAARRAVVDGMTYPPIYDVIYGGSCALLVLAISLAAPWSLALVIVAIVGLAWMMRAWSNRFGVWITGFSPPRARWVAIGLTVALLGLIFISNRGQESGLAWVPYAAAAVAFVLSIAASRLWGRVWRTEIEARP